MVGNDDGPGAVIPAVLPARMINEFVYCPRFFHLAYVGQERGENDNTVEGKWVHRGVDQSTARAAVGAETGRRVRSAHLVSEHLGISAKVDVVEFADGRAIPIEYKVGAPRSPDQPVWLPEQVQLAVAVMLLREAGHACDGGEVYFTGSKRRVPIPLTDELVERVHRSVHAMRQVAADPLPPPPLIDSPKCPACIYVGICLPDEQNLLRGRQPTAPRRLLAGDSPAHPLYVTMPGATIGKTGERITVKLKDEVLTSERLIDVSQVAIYGNATISSPLVRELLARSIPVCWFSSGGWFAGIAEGLPSKNVEMRRRQALASEKVQLRLARSMVEAKILNARVLLRRNGRPRSDESLRELKRFAIRCHATDSASSLLGVEGAAAALYFSRFATMLKSPAEPFDYQRRSRRPPVDRINCLLSFLYGLLVRDLTAVSFSVGLDPYLGVFHRPRFGRPALALDLAEEFRPLIADSVVIGLVNNGEVRKGDFVVAGGAVSLSPGGRRRALAAYERRVLTTFRHPVFGYDVTYRRAFELQARQLGAVLMGEFTAYRGVVTR